MSNLWGVVFEGSYQSYEKYLYAKRAFNMLEKHGRNPIIVYGRLRRKAYTSDGKLIKTYLEKSS